MALAALAIDGIFGAAQLVPHSRPTRSDVFMPIGLDYKLVLNVLGLFLFAALIALTLRRGATDPMCGMTVDRSKALRLEHDGVTYYFCGPGCRDRFEATRIPGSISTHAAPG
jgi:YHS domain-containing protein